MAYSQIKRSIDNLFTLNDEDVYAANILAWLGFQQSLKTDASIHVKGLLSMMQYLKREEKLGPGLKSATSIWAIGFGWRTSNSLNFGRFINVSRLWFDTLVQETEILFLWAFSYWNSARGLAMAIAPSPCNWSWWTFDMFLVLGRSHWANKTYSVYRNKYPSGALYWFKTRELWAPERSDYPQATKDAWAPVG